MKHASTRTSRSSRPRKKQAHSRVAHADWSIGLKLWVERRGEAVLGEGRADLLAAIDQTHSISAAARAIKISYRHAWLMIQSINEGAGEPFVEAVIGGVHGGGARLTEHGHAALAMFRSVSADVRRLAAGSLAHAVRSDSTETVTLRLAAAISLQEAVNQILVEYGLARPQVRVHALFGSSNELATQIERGARIDIFLSGELKHLDAIDKHRRASNVSQKIAVNRLAGVALKGASHARGRADKVLAGDFHRLAIADPDTPLGDATRRFLERRLRHPLDSQRVIYVDNANGVLAALRSGRADIGIAFASDAVMSPEVRILFQTSGGQCETKYYGAVTSQGDSTVTGEAELLLDFFHTTVAQRCLRRCGLRV